MILPPAAQELIRRLTAEGCWPETPAPHAAWVHGQAKRLGALPVGLDLWSWWFLAPAGEAILVEEGHEFEHARYTDRGRVIAALVWGSGKYPELREVFPARGPGAVDCRCAEIQRQIAEPFLCHDCGGLGWLPGGGSEGIE